VQIANQDGLRRRIAALEPLVSKEHDAATRVAVSRELAARNFAPARAA
jgi:hypothetical protein